MKRIVFATVFVLVAVAASAQTVINPTRVEFTPSADHSVVFEGQPIVTGYQLQFFASGATDPTTTVDLGKPAPVDGKISLPVDFAAVPIGQVYTAKVAAYGPGGAAASEPSNPFGRLGPPAAPTAVTLAR